MDPYEALRNSIVLQAVKDWRLAVQRLDKRPKSNPDIIVRDECERFFLSDYFQELTNMDGSTILRKLKEEEGIYDD